MRMIAFTLMMLIGSVGLAQEKAKDKTKDTDKKLSGSYSRTVGDQELTFTFKDNILKFKMTNGKDGCELEAKYTLEKDGTIKCETTKFEKKGDFPVEKTKGFTFSFKGEFKDKKLKISDFKGEDVDDNARNVLEGEYSSEK